MPQIEPPTVVIRSAALTLARRVAWKAIARAWGCSPIFVVDPGGSPDLERVDLPRDCGTLIVRVSLLTYAAGHVRHDASALRRLVEELCDATREQGGAWQLHGDPVGLLSSLIELDEEPETALRDQYGLVEGGNSWRSANALLVPVLELVAASIEKHAGVSFRGPRFAGNKTWAVAFSSDLDVLEDDHLGRVLDLLGKHGVDRPSFMVCAVDGSERTIRDVHYDIRDMDILRITEPLRRAGVEIGLHGSYLAHDRVDWLVRQKQCLEQVFEQPVRSHRSHFLRFAKPRSWTAQRLAGFAYDATLGYADMPGFRNGCASPVEYMLTPDQSIGVFSTPIIDQHFFWPDRVSDETFHAMVDPLLSEIGQLGGVITLDWHSYTIRGDGGNGWWDRLEYILAQANRGGAYIGGIGSVGDQYFQKDAAAFDSLPTSGPAVGGVAMPVTVAAGSHQREGEARHRAASENYFDTSGVWIDTPAAYQVQLRETLKVLLGQEPMTVLDVGCGNGLITNSLPSHLAVTAVDISATALRHVRVPKRQGSITALPFPDRSFDFVYCFDVIEHLSDEDMRAGLMELQRVARKHVLVAVPLNEDLAANSVCCADCGMWYHVNGHLRSHDIAWLGRIPTSEDYERSAVFLSGDVTTPPVNLLISLYWGSGIYPQRSPMHCPQCGSGAIKGEDAVRSAPEIARLADSFRSVEWANRLLGGQGWCDRSEGMVLLTRKGETARLPAATSATAVVCPLDLDFGNPLQAVAGDFTPGAIWARFKPGRGIVQDGGGIRLLCAQAPDSFPTTVNFPVCPQLGDRIVLVVSSEGDGAISCFGIHGVTGDVVELLVHCQVPDADRLEQTIDVPSYWAPGRFGLAIDIYLYGHSRLHGVRYVPQRVPPDIDVTPVRPGFNVVAVPGPPGMQTYWTFYGLSHGRLPLSACHGSEGSRCAEPLPALFGSEWEQMQDDRAHWLQLVQTTRRNTELAAELKQAQKALVLAQDTASQAQSALAQSQADLAQTQHRLARTWDFRVRRLLARHFPSAKGPLLAVRRFLGKLFFAQGRLNVGLALDLPAKWKPVDPSALPSHGGGPRVLILSHMFPHPEQPGSGSFVLEQAQALQRAGVDVRVMSGRPFWMTSHRSPLRLLGSLYNFARLYVASSTRWWLVEGVPVRFLPYPILGPFWSHGWAYGVALARNSEHLRTTFRPDLIHAHTGYLDGSAARGLAARLKLPYVITEHTGPFSMLTSHAIVRRATLKAMAGAARVVAVSDALRQDIATHQDLGEAVMTVIPNVVDVEQFQLTVDWSPQSEAPRILFVGYFTPVKNIPLLLDAFEQVLACRPAARLTLVGGGEVPQQLQDLVESIEQRGIAAAVQVKGFAERQEVARLMREECDLLVLASRSETFGCVVAEALASGKPAVITPCGGPQDIVTAPWMGEVCARNDDADALSSAILAVAGRFNTFEPRRIRESAIERFSSASVAQRLRTLYDAVLAEQAAAE